MHAHPEPKSFCSAQAQRFAAGFRARGHHVEFRDLYALQFNPISDRRNFLSVADPDYLKLQGEELHASKVDGFVPDILEEMQHLLIADLLVFSFPVWWFGMPAILKGWVDRVAAYGKIYGHGAYYEKGIGTGKHAMILGTTGGPAQAYAGAGSTPTIQTVLTPIESGIFRFLGYRPLDPWIAYAPAHVSADEREGQLRQLDMRIAFLDAHLATTGTASGG